MTNLDLRPLSLGELLDRTFLLYRQNFLIFTGIAAIPYSAVLVTGLATILYSGIGIFPTFPIRTPPVQPAHFASGMIAGWALTTVAGIVAFLFSVGASISAVSEIYLGRPASIVGSLKRAAGRIFALLGVSLLTILIILGGFLIFVVPAFIFACRMSVAITATVLENSGPSSAIRRSFRLTKGFAGRAFMIYMLYFALALAVGGTLQFPLGILVVVYAKQPHMLMLWMILMQVANFFVRVLVAPIGTISTSLYYYDLRVRKEAFDLQMMMQSLGDGSLPPLATAAVPSVSGPDAS